MKGSANPSFHRSDDETKVKLPYGGPSVDFQGCRHGTFKKQPLLYPQQGQPRAYQISDNFTPLKLPIQDVFEAIKGQLLVKSLEANTHDPARPEARDYCSFHNKRDTELLNVGLSASTLKILSSKAIFEYIFAPRASLEAERQPEIPCPSQLQHMITQYKTVD